MKVFRTILLAVLAVLAVLVTPACSGIGAAPPPNVVTAIQDACNADAVARPIANLVLATPGLATPADLAVVAAARSVIDPICANPGGSPVGNAAAAVLSASGQISAVVAQIQARKAAAPPAKPASAS